MIELCGHAQEQSIGPGPASKLKLLPAQPLAGELDLVVLPVEPNLLAALRIRVQPLASHSVVIDLETVGVPDAGQRQVYFVKRWFHGELRLQRKGNAADRTWF